MAQAATGPQSSRYAALPPDGPENALTVTATRSRPAALAEALAPPLAGVVVLGAAARLADRLAGWGARPVSADDGPALRQALSDSALVALAWLPPGALPVRPPAEIAAALRAGDHPGRDAGDAWCLSAATARRLGDGAADAAALAERARSALPRPAAPLAHRRPDGAALSLADLPAAFGSGLPFAGPFGDDPVIAARALAGTSAQARAPVPSLPDGLAPIGPPPAPRPGEILALLVVRNEELRLPAAIEAARQLGVDRFIVIDNRSTDGTRDVALRAGAHLIDAPGDYAASSFGITWTNAVLDAWGRGHWALVLDADEQLVFPGSDRVGLPALTRHLDAQGAEAFRTIMLDCFPRGPLTDCAYRPGEDLSAAAPLFEPPRLRRERIEDFPGTLDYGGIRERLFFPEADPANGLRWLRQKLFNLGLRVPGLRESARFRAWAPPRSPTVTKLPLIRWREGAALLASTHRIAPMRLAAEQPSGVLLHYKFLQDFHERAVDAVTRAIHYDGSREYRRYLRKLEADPAFSLAGPLARPFTGPDALVELGLMEDTLAWRQDRAAASL